MPNQLRKDPTRTTMIRKRWIADFNRRFKWLTRLIKELIIEDDAFGLKPPAELKILVAKQAWRFNTDAQKVQAFQQWLGTNVNLGVLETGTQPPWVSEYVQSGYRKGLVNSYTQMNQLGAVSMSPFYQGSQRQFLLDAFAQPETMQKIELIYTRAYSELKGVTSAMEQQLSRSLAAGLARGDGPHKIAREMTQVIGGINRRRARVIARTETAYAHAEGQLDAFKKLGVNEVGIKAEWSTAADACPLCAPLEGVVMTVKEAEGLIPYHPNCRCAWVPALDDHPQKGQLWGKDREYAIYKSFKQGGGIKKSRWLGKEKFKYTGKTQTGAKAPLPTKAIAEAGAKKAGPASTALPPAKKSTAEASTVVKKKKASERRPRKPKVKEYTPIKVKGVAKNARIDPYQEFKVLDSNIGGSTGAKLVEVRNIKTGTTKKYVMKAYSGNEVQVNNEFLANRLYKQMGADVPNTYIGNVNGKRVLFTEYHENLTDVRQVWLNGGEKAQKIVQEMMEEHFTTDAWLANWDVVGLEMDNIALKGDAILRLDNGGALLLRAQGAPKGPLFTNVADEIFSMRSAKNISAQKMFGHIDDDKLLKLIKRFEFRYKNIRPELRKTIISAGFDQERTNLLLTRMKLRADSVRKIRLDLELKANMKAKTPLPRPKGKGAQRVHETKSALDGDDAFRKKTLTNTEKDGIHDFTGHHYEDINPQVLDDNITSRIKAIDSGLEKLPGYDGYVARGVKNLPPEQFQNYKSGNWAHVWWKSFSSSSTQSGSEFGSQNGICFIIKSKGVQGRWVKPISSHTGEMEVLFKRNSYFRVVGVAENPTGASHGFSRAHKKIVLLEEIEAGAKIPESQLAPKVFDYKELYQMYKDGGIDAGFSSY